MSTTTTDLEMVKVRAAIDALYTPLDEALELLRERRADEKLRALVSDFHRAHPPDFLPDAPCAFWTRHISTPNQEFDLFASTVRTTDLQPLCLESADDIFVSRNPDKYCLCRPFFEISPGRFRGLPIMDGTGVEGRRLCDLRLANGMSLRAFHRALLHNAFPGIERHIHDFSEWFTAAQRHGDFYLHYLSLFISDGILFENFVAADPEERRFACEKVLPSNANALETFGVKPLIVPLLPTDTEDHECWRSHPGALYSVAVNIVRGRSDERIRARRSQGRMQETLGQPRIEARS